MPLLKKKLAQYKLYIDFLKNIYFILQQFTSDPIFSFNNIWELEHIFLVESLERFIKQRDNDLIANNYSAALLCDITCKVNGNKDSEWTDFLPVLPEAKKAEVMRRKTINTLFQKYQDRMDIDVICKISTVIEKYLVEVDEDIAT